MKNMIHKKKKKDNHLRKLNTCISKRGLIFLSNNQPSNIEFNLKAPSCGKEKQIHLL